MKQLLIIGCALVGVFGFGSNVLAFQEVSAIVTSTFMDQGNQICTIYIDRSHYKTTQTARCRDRAFSWKCLPDDYRFQLAQGTQNRHPIQIRYSEYGCENQTGNMRLLTVW